MPRVIEELWYGNIDPQIQRVEGNKEIKNLLNLMGKKRDELSATLTDKQKEILEKYDDCLSEMYCIIERETFVYSFKLGGRIMLETLSDNTI